MVDRISIAPNGLLALSGGHGGALRLTQEFLDEEAPMDEILDSIRAIVESPSEPPRPWWKRLVGRLFPVRQRMAALEAEVRRVASVVEALAVAASKNAEPGKRRVLTQAEIDSLLGDTEAVRASWPLFAGAMADNESL